MPEPQLTHFIGQSVKSVSSKKGEHGYPITLESGAKIYSSRKVEEDIKGKLLCNVLYPLEDGRDIQLLFYSREGEILNDKSIVELHPDNYMVETEGHEAVNPKIEGVPPSGGEVLPPDPSPERFLTGPPGGPESGSKPLAQTPEGIFQEAADLQGDDE